MRLSANPPEWFSRGWRSAAGGGLALAMLLGLAGCEKNQFVGPSAVSMQDGQLMVAICTEYAMRDISVIVMKPDDHVDVWEAEDGRGTVLPGTVLSAENLGQYFGEVIRADSVTVEAGDSVSVLVSGRYGSVIGSFFPQAGSRLVETTAWIDPYGNESVEPCPE